MKRVEQSERSATRGVAEARREVNRDSIVFLLLSDTEQKVVSEFSELQILGICPVPYSLFYTIFWSFFKLNIRQIFLYHPILYFLANQTHP